MIAWYATRQRVLPGHRLDVEFANGLCGVVDMSGDNFRGILKPLADAAYFRLASIRDGVVVW